MKSSGIISGLVLLSAAFGCEIKYPYVRINNPNHGNLLVGDGVDLKFKYEGQAPTPELRKNLQMNVAVVENTTGKKHVVQTINYGLTEVRIRIANVESGPCKIGVYTNEDEVKFDDLVKSEMNNPNEMNGLSILFDVVNDGKYEERIQSKNCPSDDMKVARAIQIDNPPASNDCREIFQPLINLKNKLGKIIKKDPMVVYREREVTIKWSYIRNYIYSHVNIILLTRNPEGGLELVKQIGQASMNETEFKWIPEEDLVTTKDYLIYIGSDGEPEKIFSAEDTGNSKGTVGRTFYIRDFKLDRILGDGGEDNEDETKTVTETQTVGEILSSTTTEEKSNGRMASTVATIGSVFILTIGLCLI